MKPTINKLNYEQYVLDFLENRLDLDTQVAFSDFLEANPDIAKEIEDYLKAPMIAHVTPTPQYPSKHTLYRRRIPLLVLILIGAAILLSIGLWWSHHTKEAGETKTKVQEKSYAGNNHIEESTVLFNPIEEENENKANSKLPRFLESSSDYPVVVQDESDHGDNDNTNNESDVKKPKSYQQHQKVFSAKPVAKVATEQSTLSSVAMIGSTPDDAAVENVPTNRNVFVVAHLARPELRSIAPMTARPSRVFLHLPPVPSTLDQNTTLASTSRPDLEELLLPGAFEDLEEQVSAPALLASNSEKSNNLWDNISKRLIPKTFTK